MPKVVSMEQARLDLVLGRMAGDMRSVANAALVLIGDKLGLYETMRRIGPTTPSRLAAEARISEPSVREWLAAQAASGHIVYDAAAGRYRITPRQAAALSDEGSPLSIASASEFLASYFEGNSRSANRRAGGSRR